MWVEVGIEGGREGGREDLLLLRLPVPSRSSLDSFSDSIHLGPHDGHLGGVACCHDHQGEEGGAEDQGRLEGGREGGREGGV